MSTPNFNIPGAVWATWCTNCKSKEAEFALGIDFEGETMEVPLCKECHDFLLDNQPEDMLD